MLRVLSRAILALGIATSVLAQQPSSPAAPAPVARDPLHAPAGDVTISLLTMGNGDQVWELFGHQAILIHDNTTGRDTVFNWGVFDFHQERFIPRFLQGRMLYSMGSDSLGWVMLAYRYLNRPVRMQELDLTPPQRETILRRIQWNTQPENVNYRYDYFQDNCATRIRDIIDEALGGQLRAQAQTPSGTTYRLEALRLMQGDKPIALGVDIGLGRPADRELTKWQEMFLPRKVHDFVATMQVRDSAGGTHPLVKNETVLFASTRDAEAEQPPKFGPWLLLGGLITAAVFLWLGSQATERRSSTGLRVVAAVVVGLWSLAAGLLGLLLTLLWTVTDHVFAHQNENLLLFNPLWLILCALMVRSLWTGRVTTWTKRFAFGLAALGVLALLAHVVRLSAQNNLPIIALALPPRSRSR